MRFVVRLLCLLAFGAGTVANAAKVDTVPIYSNAMKSSFKCVVIKPASYGKHKKLRLPVVYLLHGYSGKYSDWIIKVPELKKYADELNLMIVCPDGGYASWYFNSKLQPNSQYETYIAREVPAYIDKHYRTDTSRKSTAITGLSMGGHGALYLTWKHSDQFGAAASISGGVDLSQSVRRFEIEKLIGENSTSASEWEKHSVLTTIQNIPPHPVALLIDCGVTDMFIEGNRKLHARMLELKIPHEYIERPGGHSWQYWKYAIHSHLLFFKKYFDQKLLLL
jgi:S-formylglutathione hydrolase FrmB